MTQTNPEMIAVVMAGGRGTRFWPRSRGHRPKQFLAMVGTETLLHQTVNRLKPTLPGPEHLHRHHRRTWRRKPAACCPSCPRRTSWWSRRAAIRRPAWPWPWFPSSGAHPEGVMVVLSADHFIGEPETFLGDIEVAVHHAAEAHELVTFGIRPTYPETGYGYIETSGQGAVVRVEAFREKPPYEKALEYLASGRHFWNAGMFVWTLRDLRSELLRHCPEVLAPLDAWVAGGLRSGHDRGGVSPAAQALHRLCAHGEVLQGGRGPRALPLVRCGFLARPGGVPRARRGRQRDRRRDHPPG